ncbi:MAG: RagB/SusD family nutrient uptake outer membrane protein [Bacteroidales bacterium]|nr:RagB/SusD family nutrient uptake outer membrane protein [Bacteroidales bacterium]
MKKILIMFPVLIIVSLSGCEKVLDKQDLNALDDDVWESVSLSTQYLNKLYQDNMPGFSLGTNSGYSDETFYDNDFVYGLLIESSVGNFSLATFNKIRNINLMIEGVESSSIDEESKNLLGAQAHFLRAWRYWELVNLYGGVPMVLDVQDPWFDELNIPRSKTSECIDAIVSDLDEGIQNLPARYINPDDYGRITSVAAAAMKGRVLLFWASPSFNPENKAERWQRAYTANLEAKQLLDDEGYGLLDDFSQIFLVEGNANTEAIMVRSYDDTYIYGGWEASVRPPSGGGNGSNAPTWNLVKAFPMANGMLPDEAGSGYNATYYWQNRDPRFYHTIAYNGCEWELTGREETVQWTYFLNSQEDRRTPSTGFYCRKGSNPEIHKDNTDRTPTDWIEIRYAEVLLNLAECANETDRMNEAYDLLKLVRERAGIEPGANNMYGLKESMTKSEMREIIMIERQVELAFENKRYWDLRRRNMYIESLGAYTPKLNGTQRMGIIVMPKPPLQAEDIDTIRNTIDVNSADYTTYFMVIPKKLDTQYKINYLQPKYNFFAIPQNILDRSPAIKQTLGWENGEFDPYEE